MGKRGTEKATIICVVVATQAALMAALMRVCFFFARQTVFWSTSRVAIKWQTPRVGVLIARRGIAKCFSASAHVLASALGPFTTSQSHARKVNAYVTFVQFFELSNSKNSLNTFFQKFFFYCLYQIYTKYMPNTKHLITLNLVWFDLQNLSFKWGTFQFFYFILFWSASPNMRQLL